MKLTKREKILIAVLFVMICAVLYYLLYLSPQNMRIADIKKRIEQKTQAIDNNSILTIRFGALSSAKNLVMENWNEIIDILPENFDDVDILNRIENIIIPHESQIKIRFPDNGILMTQTAVYPVEITFNVSYTALQKILDDFESQDILNRITKLSYVQIQGQEYQVTLTVDFLTHMFPAN